MLDAISDFWKPSKKTQNQEKLRPEQLQIGSSLGFGFVPQVSLSGRRLQVVAINTYKFGDEALTSFALSQDKDPAVSMIIAESDGEQYLAISRRISISDRMKLFDSQELQNVMEKADAEKLSCKDAIPDFKGWVVGSYKRELQGMEGHIYKGDFRKAALPAAEGQEFEYTLLVSESNEHAIEIEQYKDGRVEVYATVYRRRSDIGEVTHPVRNDMSRPDLKLASAADTAPAASPIKAVPTPEPASVVQAAKAEPIKLQEFAKPAESTNKPVPVMKTETKPEIKKPEEKSRMETTQTPMNGANGKAGNVMSSQAAPAAKATAQQSYKQEVKAVSTLNGSVMDNEAIECDLRVANKIIDEAIRNEMRLSDVVRRIVELPVANQEAVQIPVTLTDEDYSLLAIRYGISSADRNAIKTRIIDDLNSFSGDKKKAA